jgi:hypothetical protein
MAHTSPLPACAGMSDGGQGLDDAGAQPSKGDSGPAADKAVATVDSMTSDGQVLAACDVQPPNGQSGAEGSEAKEPSASKTDP